MDTIEVTVEEMIAKHARDLDAEERERVKWMKSEVAYFDKMNPSQSGGGFFDQIIKAITGGGKGGGIMGAGVAGGMVAGGVMALIDVLKDAVSNSKILTTVLGTIMQALGLLIDVILLPFLPILITGIIWLYQGIMLFHKLWSGIWSSKVVQLIGTALTDLGKILAKGFAGILTLTIGALTGTAGAIWSVVTWLWELATKNTAVNIALSLLLGPVGILLNWLYTLVTGKQTPTVTLMLQIAGAAVSFLQWLWNTITSGGANLLVNITSGSGNAVSNAVSGAGSTLSTLSSDIGSAISNPIGWLQGAASEVESAASSAATTVTNVFNFPNYLGSKADVTKAVNDANRQNQYRYNV